MPTEYALETGDWGTHGRPQADAQVGNNMQFSEFNVPGSVTPGKTFTVSGEIYLDALVSVTDVDSRVVVSAPELGIEETVDTDKLGAGGSDTFSVEMTAPESAGSTISVTAEAHANPPDWFLFPDPIPIGSGWQKTDERDAKVNVVSQQQKALGYAPWAIGGGGAGYLIARNRGSSPAVGALAGAGLGAGVKQAGGTDTIPDIGDFTPNPWTLAAGAALLGSGAWLLTSAQSATGGTLGSAVGTIGSGVGSGASSVAGRLRSGSSR